MKEGHVTSHCAPVIDDGLVVGTVPAVEFHASTPLKSSFGADMSASNDGEVAARRLDGAHN